MNIGVCSRSFRRSFSALGDVSPCLLEQRKTDFMDLCISSDCGPINNRMAARAMQDSVSQPRNTNGYRNTELCCSKFQQMIEHQPPDNLDLPSCRKQSAAADTIPFWFRHHLCPGISTSGQQIRQRPYGFLACHCRQFLQKRHHQFK